MSPLKKKSSSSGFSLLELLIAMAITMVLVTAAVTLLASGLRMRTRENQ
jgi:prepilin-type N-terminal cleavage/methylation domain-containing protein